MSSSSPGAGKGLPVHGEGSRYGHPAFEGLSQAQVDHVYHHGNLRTLAPGEFLFREDGRVRQHYLILDGALRLCLPGAGSHAPQSVLRQGELLAAMPAAARIEDEISAVAQEKLSVLELEDAALSRLPEHVQALLFRNLLRLSSSRLRNMRLELSKLTGRQDSLVGELRARQESGTRGYEEAPVIRDFLQRIPRLPPYAANAARLLDDKASARDLVEMARLDPSLVGIVLKTVNSAYYGLQQKVSNFQHAAMLLGFHQIYQILVNTGLRSTMPRTPEFQHLQFHSMMISVLAFEICQVTRRGNGQSAGTIGLLHDIGKSVLLLLERQSPKLSFFIGLLDSNKIGSMLLKEWGLPAEICQTLEYQDFAALMPAAAIPEPIRHHAAVLHLAHLCLEHLEGREEPPASLFLADYQRLLGIEPGSVEGFVRDRLLPPMLRRLNTFPQPVQRFLFRPE